MKTLIIVNYLFRKFLYFFVIGMIATNIPFVYFGMMLGWPAVLLTSIMAAIFVDLNASTWRRFVRLSTVSTLSTLVAALSFWLELGGERGAVTMYVTCSALPLILFVLYFTTKPKIRFEI